MYTIYPQMTIIHTCVYLNVYFDMALAVLSALAREKKLSKTAKSKADAILFYELFWFSNSSGEPLI